MLTRLGPLLYGGVKNETPPSSSAGWGAGVPAVTFIDWKGRSFVKLVS